MSMLTQIIGYVQTNSDSTTVLDTQFFLNVDLYGNWIIEKYVKSGDQDGVSTFSKGSKDIGGNWLNRVSLTYVDWNDLYSS